MSRRNEIGSGLNPKITPSGVKGKTSVKATVERVATDRYFDGLLLKKGFRLRMTSLCGTTDDQIYTKADAIDDVKNGTHQSLDLDNIKVRIFGDTAVVTMGQTEKSRHGDADFSGHYLFTDVWTKKNGEWIAVASHGSRAR